MRIGIAKANVGLSSGLKRPDLGCHFIFFIVVEHSLTFDSYVSKHNQGYEKVVAFFTVRPGNRMVSDAALKRS
jgi:hypothetical protein